MKIIKLFLIIFIVVFINSCDNFNPVEPIGMTSEVYSISGKLNGWNLGSNKQVIFIGANEIFNSDKVYSTSKIDSNGNFSLTNLDSPTKVMFMNPVCPQYFGDLKVIRNKITCSDSSANKVYGYLVITLADDTSYTGKGDIYRKNFSNWCYYSDDSVKTGDFSAKFIYADKDARLSGIIEFDDTYGNYKYHSTIEYNLNLKKGWNKEVTLIKSQKVSRDSGYTKIVSTRRITNYELLGGRWDYNYYGD
jgi:hypothetical protein